jgi:type IV secretory pathway VirB10-like protein
MTTTTTARLLAAGALMAFATLAQAQYMWIDEKGLKQFSDRAPPPSIPLKNILQAPRGAASALTLQAEPTAAVSEPAKLKSAPSLAERNADYLKRSKEKAEREQKEHSEQESRLAQAENCERARAAKQSIDSGVRIGTIEKNGERGFMNDDQRAAEGMKVNQVLAACK